MITTGSRRFGASKWASRSKTDSTGTGEALSTAANSSSRPTSWWALRWSAAISERRGLVTASASLSLHEHARAWRPIPAPTVSSHPLLMHLH